MRFASVNDKVFENTIPSDNRRFYHARNFSWEDE
jgi:hypothetical protein